jgi:MFS family permease
VSDAQSKPPLLSRSWFHLVLAHAFLLQGLTLIVRVATTYRALEIGLDAFWIGVVGGAFGVLPALLGLHLGGWIDRYGEITPMRIGSAMVVAATLAFWLIGDALAVLILSSVVLGLGQFICLAGEHSAIARCAPDSQRDIFFGRFTVAISLSQAVSPAFLTLFGHDSLVPETDGIFLAGCFVALLTLVTALLLQLRHEEPAADRTGVWGTMLRLAGIRGFGLSVIAGLVLFSAMDLLVIYMPLYGAERGISAGIIGTLLGLRAVASIGSRLMFGRLIALLGRGGLLVAAMLTAGGGIALLPLTTDITLLAFAMMAAGFGIGIGAPLTLAWVSEISPAGTRATALALRLAANRVGQALLPVGVGAAVAGIGAAGVLWATSMTLGICALLSARFFRLGRRS